MRTQILLATFGIALGLSLLGGVYFVAKEFSLLPPGLVASEATHFESVADFHRKMLGHDQRDEHGDKSVSLRSIITPHLNERVLYDLLPNQRVQFQGVPVRLNNCGMRGEDVEIPRSPKTVRIAFLGDSFTFGWGVEEDESFVAVTEEVLNRWLASYGYQAEVLNFGTPGYSTFQEVELFLSEDREFQPDIVVVFFIANDFGLPFFIRGFGTDGEMVTSTHYEKTVQSSQDETLRAKRAELVNKLDPNRALRQLVQSGREEGFRTLIAFNPHPKWKESYQKLWFVRKSRQIGVIDLRDRFLEAMHTFQLKESELSLPDDPHPSAYKHAILGGLLAESLFPEVSLFVERDGDVE
ncbi:MAG: SGNH/GDSL hydrolase family protein [Bdellovibrionales bacterium]|nr:SGNH/GDSL hydrolase family protein [Bdellovibrionales bacterium]